MKYLKLLFVFVLFSCGGSDTPTPPPTPSENIAPTVTGRASDYDVKTNEEIDFNANINDVDGDNSKVKTRWDFDGNGTYDTPWAAHNIPVAHKFTQGGNYISSVQAKDEKGATTEKDLNLIEVHGNVAPTPNGTISDYDVKTNELITFNSNTTTDPDGDNSKIQTRWDFDGDGTYDTSFQPYTTSIEHKFTEAGNYIPTLEAKDDENGVATKTFDTINVAGNIAPTAQGQADKTNGLISDVYNFDWSASDDPDGNNSDLEARIISKEGITPSAWTPYGTAISHTFAQGGNYNPILEVKDKDGSVGSTTLGNLGVLDPANNPIDINVIAPRYLEAGKEFNSEINASENENRPLDYSINFGEGWNNTNTNQSHTYSTPGVKTLEAMATSDYNISNSESKEIEVGPEKPSTNYLFGPDGEKYRIAFVGGKLITVDDYKGMVPDYEGKTEEAPFFDNDSISYSQVFGKLYSRDDVNKGLDKVVFHDNAGNEWKAHVTTMEEFDEIIAAYGGYDNAGTELKYDGFDSNGNNSSRAAMMLGGYQSSSGEFLAFGEAARYFTGTEYNDTENVMVYLKKNDNLAKKNLSRNNTRYAVKFTIEQGN